MVAKRHLVPWIGCLLVPLMILVAVLAVCERSVHAAEIKIDRPKDREFVRDLAGMIDAEHKKHLVELCDKLLTEKATPILVVTIDSMKKHGGEAMRIETFANLLFNQWEIGHAKLGKHDWDTGILLLVSKGDRKARIELGKGWGREKDKLCTQIMSQQIIARFKQKKFSEGIVAGVEALDKMARGLELPPPPPSKTLKKIAREKELPPPR